MSTARMFRLAPALLLPIALAGCSVLSDSRSPPPTIYAPLPQVQASADWPQVQWQLTIARPEAARMLDTLRIAVRPNGQEMQVYAGSNWARPPADQIVDALMQVLADSGRAPAVTRQGSGMGNDYRLLLDLRRFDSDYAGQTNPQAVIEVNAKLLRMRDQRVIANQTFRQAHQAADNEVPQVVAAFETGLTALTHDLAGWTLRAGQADYQQTPR